MGEDVGGRVHINIFIDLLLKEVHVGYCSFGVALLGEVHPGFR
jgi:hypothetical protein